MKLLLLLCVLVSRTGLSELKISRTRPSSSTTRIFRVADPNYQIGDDWLFHIADEAFRIGRPAILDRREALFPFGYP
jgi:hypothetical protein